MEYKSTLEGLKNVYERATKLGDDIMSIVDKEKDPEVKALITGLANQCYSLAVDTKDNAETYKEMTTEEAEKAMNNFDNISDNPEGEEDIAPESSEEFSEEGEEELEPIDKNKPEEG